MSTAIVIQPKFNSQSMKMIIRLGWTSFVFGACAFLIHCISLSRLATISSLNIGIISGFFLMAAGMASIAAGHRKLSYGYFFHAQIWSLMVNILFIPGLIAVSIAALIIDGQDVDPICQQTSRTILFGSSFEVYPSNIPCIQAMHTFETMRTLNCFQLIVGVASFFVHIGLISMQRKAMQNVKLTSNHQDLEQNYHEMEPGKILVYTQPSIIVDANPPLSDVDPPPKYDDLPGPPSSSD